MTRRIAVVLIALLWLCVILGLYALWLLWARSVGVKFE